MDSNLNVFKFHTNIFKKIKFAFQRIKKGYCDWDKWEIHCWLAILLRDIIKEYDETRCGYPLLNEIKDEDCDKEWSSILNKISTHFDNYIRSEEVYPCEHEEEFENLISAKFKDKLINDERFEEIRKIYIEEEINKEKASQEDIKEAFALIVKYYKDLWD